MIPFTLYVPINRRIAHEAWLALFIVLWTSNRLSGEITRFEARVETRVQELIFGAPASVNSDGMELPGDVDEFPIAASAFLATTELGGERTAVGQGFGAVADPTRLNDPNPQEFALETACFSNAADVSYIIESSAIESRIVVFDRNDLDTSSANAQRTVRSRVFLSGAVILWSTGAEAALDELTAEISIAVTRDEDANPLFDTSLTVNGSDRAPSAAGAIRFEAVNLDELASLGLDEATLAVLERVEEEGSLLVIVIPSQEHAYRYAASPDAELTLRASMEIRLRNAPAGTGVAAVLGRPFEELAQFIEEALPGVNGRTIEGAINKASARRSGDLAPPSDTPVIPSLPRLCGPGGVAMISLLLVFGLAKVTIRRR